MRILVTGAAGFIGSHLVRRLCEKNHRVVGWLRNAAESSALSVARRSRLSHPNYSDFNPQSPTAFDACVHLAGRSSVRESLQMPAEYAEANLGFSMALLKFLQGTDCRRVIHASTVMVYGKDAPSPYQESRIGSAPASIYGASKLAAEIAVNAWRALHKMETINLRLFSVYGPDLRPDCVPHLIASAIRDEREFTVFGDGSSVRDYVEIEDVLDAIEAALAVSWRENFPTAINIGSGRGTSLTEILTKIEQGMLKNARIARKPAQAGELQTVVADVALAERELNWRPKVGIDAGMARFTEWFKKHA